MKRWKIVFLNNLLKKQGVWSIEAASEEEAIAKFRQAHQNFCEVYSISPMKTR